MDSPRPHMDPRLARRLQEKQAALAARRPLAPATLRLIHEDLQVRLTFHSNAIEGNTLSLRETQLVIERGLTIGGHTLAEHLEATNHAAAVRALLAMADAEAPLGVATILELHRLVMERMLDEAGAWRSGAVSIRGSALQPPPAAQVPGLMDEWLAWLDGPGRAYGPVERAAIAHHGFVAVHPFRDGNGRTGRLLLNLLLLRAGFPPALLLQEWRLGYLEALSQADRGRYGPLLNLVGRAVEIGLDLYLEACDAAPPQEDLLPLRELAAGGDFSAEYLALLIRKGRLAGSKRGGRWYSTRAALARYVAEVARQEVPRGRPAKPRP
ncbi:Fic family protein [Oscillochloris sp. ZM17-4]|uniref:Fic family protein n=1 Tax=Oscillochloris sp. ZM17-4 TaxID=2866714 RepID=UPI001C737B67|nr:Fic family protein [Oscillochloris sp. ZM17-4]MBX0327398.1 Fic family protein [Oscillochloris sp. ZM17-4]